MSSWSRVADREEAEFGIRYRTSFFVARIAFVGPVVQALYRALELARAGARVAGVRIVSYEIYGPGRVPENVNAPAHELARGAWLVRVEWEKSGPGTPVHVLVAAIALIVTAVVGWLVVATVTEKQLAALGAGLSDAARRLFNPGMAIAAVIAIALITRKGS